MTNEQIAIDIAKIQTTLDRMERDLMGNGQPGRIARLETRMALVEDFESKAKGVIAIVSLGTTAIGGFLAKHLFGK